MDSLYTHGGWKSLLLFRVRLIVLYYNLQYFYNHVIFGKIKLLLDCMLYYVVRVV